jgi:glutamate carboxypeptidase
VNEHLAFLQRNAPSMLDDLRRFASLETPSEDKTLLNAFAAMLADYAQALEARVELVHQTEHGDHLLLRWNVGSPDPPALLLGHYDTVWPAGTLDEFPPRQVGNRLSGPGSFDMKAGLVQGLWAVRAYREAGGCRPIVFLINSDEEIGSPSSRSLIEDHAKQSAFVLVLEPSDRGNLKTARRGVARYRIDVHGRASHAGLAPEKGVSAIDELCRLLLQLKSAVHAAPGIDPNVGVIAGGTRYNVVPAHAFCEIDIRTTTQAEAVQVRELVAGLRTLHADARIEISGGSLWPPMERNARIETLAEHAKHIARSLGFELGETRSGGASDGCHCAAVGAAVLDGLGPVGDGAHSRDEHVIISDMPLRSALVAGLLTTLPEDRDPQEDAPVEPETQ